MVVAVPLFTTLLCAASPGGRKPVAFSFLKKRLVYLSVDRRREEEREGEKHRYVVTSHAPPTGDLACNPGMCPDWESNQQPFGSQVH